MKNFNVRDFVIFALAAISGAALLNVSQRVQHAEERLSAIKAEIAQEEDAVRLLRAEWAYLNRPGRLERMAQDFLDLLPPRPDTMQGEMMEKASELDAAPYVSEDEERAL